MWSSGLGIQRQQLRFDPWFGNLHVPQMQPKKEILVVIRPIT